jgi:hypothetical protein
MAIELNADDAALMIGRLYLENYRLGKELPLLQRQIDEMTAELNKLRSDVKGNVLVVKERPPESEVA